MRCRQPEWMHEMTIKQNGTLATVVLMSLLANAAVAAEDKDVVTETNDATVADRVLLEAANTAAVTDAIEALLVENKLDLDIRFADRTSETVVDGP